MTTLKDPPKNILVPVDFSESSGKAAAAACTLGGTAGAKIHLLHAYMIPVAPAGPGQTVSKQYVDQFVADSKARLQELGSKLCDGAALGPFLVESGDPRDVILEQAQKLHADLIVMGTHGRRGITRALLGSVAESVVRTAHCSVLVVR